MNQLIDTHAHLDLKHYTSDLLEVISRAKQTGLNTLINVGSSLETSQKVLKQTLELSTPDFQIFSTIGIHPHYAPSGNYVKFILDKISALEKIYLTHPEKVKAVGECGLDYFKHEGNVTEAEKKGQKLLFQAQIDLARKLKLPLIIHCRDAWEEIFDFDYSGITGVFHSFTSNQEDAEKALKLGFYLSFSCIVTYPKNNHLREVIKTMPLEKILTETDSPFLPPQSIRGERNEPANVKEVAKIISELKKLNFEETAKIILSNAHLLYNWS